MHTQQKARAKVVGLVEAPRKAHGGDAAERVSGEVGGSPLRGAATWAEEVEKSPRFFTLWKETGIGEGRRKRWRGGEVVWDSPPRGGRARAFETRFSSPIHLFLSSTPIEKRCSRAQLSEEWIPSMKRFLLRDEEKKFHFLIHALCNRAVWKSDGGVGGSILSPRLLRVLFSRIFVEISREEKSKYIIEEYKNSGTMTRNGESSSSSFLNVRERLKNNRFTHTNESLNLSSSLSG